VAKSRFESRFDNFLKVVKSKWPNPDLNPDLTTFLKLSNLSGQI